MADTSLRAIDIADQSSVDLLYKDVGSSKHAPAVQLVDAAGALVNPAAPVIGAGTAIIGKVGIDQTTPGTTNAVTQVGSDGTLVNSPQVYRPSVTVDTAAYVDLDCIGGIISLTNFVAVSGGKAEIHGIEITELGAQKPPLTISFYKATPAGGTYTDNAGLVLDATDVADRTGVPVQFLAGDYKAHGTHQVASLTFQPFVVECAVTTLFMLLQADGAYDAVAASDFKMRILYKRIG